MARFCSKVRAFPVSGSTRRARVGMRDLSIMTMRKLAAALLIVLVHLASPRARAAPPAPAAKLPLATGWNLQSSAKAQVTGDVVSTPRFAPRGWYTTDVPSTVVAALVARKV